MRRVAEFIALAAIEAALLGLAVWQFDRASQADARREARAQMAASPPRQVTPAELAALTIPSRVELACEPGPPVALVPSPSRRQREGFRVLALCHGEAGPAVLVDLGFAPADTLPAALSTHPTPPLVGLAEAWPTGVDASGAPPQVASLPVYPPRSLAAAAASLGASTVGLTLDPGTDDEALDGPLTPGWPLEPPHRPHLEYALFWLTCSMLLGIQVWPRWINRGR